MSGDIHDMRKQLAEVTAELARRPPHMAGTEWESDRLEELAWLTRSIERQAAARRARAELN